MDLVGCQHEPVSLDVNEVCFDEKQDILDTGEKSSKSQSGIEWCEMWEVRSNGRKCQVLDLRRS